MASNQERKVSGFLYAEIARLKQQILEIGEHHRDELSAWTQKCGQRGNVIGNLRKQLAAKENEFQIEHRELLLWMKKCGNMGNEIGRLRKRLAETESDLEAEHEATLHALTTKYGDLGNEIGRLRKQLAENVTDLAAEHEATLHSWTKKCGELATEIIRLQEKLFDKEIECQTERDRSKREIEMLKQCFEKMEIEHQTDILKQRIESDLKILIDHPEADVTVDNQDLSAQCNSGQINDVEADRIVKTYYSSDGEMDDVNQMIDPVGDNVDVSGSITEDILPLVTDQMEPNDVVKQKPKFLFWTALKRHVSLKDPRTIVEVMNFLSDLYSVIQYQSYNCSVD